MGCKRSGIQTEHRDVFQVGRMALGKELPRFGVLMANWLNSTRSIMTNFMDYRIITIQMVVYHVEQHIKMVTYMLLPKSFMVLMDRRQNAITTGRVF